jgi:hypothetical protein
LTVFRQAGRGPIRSPQPLWRSVYLQSFCSSRRSQNLSSATSTRKDFPIFIDSNVEDPPRYNGGGTIPRPSAGDSVEFQVFMPDAAGLSLFLPFGLSGCRIFILRTLYHVCANGGPPSPPCARRSESPGLPSLASRLPARIRRSTEIDAPVNPVARLLFRPDRGDQVACEEGHPERPSSCNGCQHNGCIENTADPAIHHESTAGNRVARLIDS